MKFNFHLKGVLVHRKILEDLANREFMVALNHLKSLDIDLKNLENSSQEALQFAHLRQNHGGNVVPYLTQAHEFLLGQDLRIERKKEEIQIQEKKVEELREILRQKALDYKMIENLMEKKKKEFYTQLSKKEQKEIDSINTMRFQHGEDLVHGKREK